MLYLFIDALRNKEKKNIDDLFIMDQKIHNLCKFFYIQNKQVKFFSSLKSSIVISQEEIYSG